MAAVVIPFQDIVQARRRNLERAYAQCCIDIIESSLHLALEEFDAAPPAERPLYARRVRQLGALLEYAVQVL
ncbi:MAG: hypothetical protein ACE5I7_09485 [Candidatus Binatia bacterium]